MTVVRKKGRQTTVTELVQALGRLGELLEGQNETAAAQDLKIAAHDLSRYQLGTEQNLAALSLIREAFDGDHELISYTLRGADSNGKGLTRAATVSGNWSEADELYLASTSVLALLGRLLGSSQR